MKFNIFNLEIGERIPEGYRLIEAYAKGNTIIVPIMDIPEDEAHLHNCDWEGCGTIDHVVRFSVNEKYASAPSYTTEADPITGAANFKGGNKARSNK